MKREDLGKLMMDVETYSPVLLMRDAVKDFIKNYEGKIERVRNVDDVRELISYYVGIPDLGRTLVIEGISFLNQRASFMLLKLVEESKLPIVLLSRFDNVSEIILSRIRTTLKYNNQKVNSEFLEINDGRDVVRDKVSEDSHYYDVLKNYSKYSPIMYYIEENMKVRRGKDKIMDILG